MPLLSNCALGLPGRMLGLNASVTFLVGSALQTQRISFTAFLLKARSQLAWCCQKA